MERAGARVADIVRIKGVKEEKENARIWYREGSTLRIIVKGEGRGCRVTRNPMEIAVKAAYSLSSRPPYAMQIQALLGPHQGTGMCVCVGLNAYMNAMHV